MSDKTDTSILARIGTLVEQEQQLYQKGHPSEDELAHLDKIKIELDQCWDLLRRRPPEVVEKYLG